MIYVNDENLLKFGRVLADLRNSKKVTFEELSEVTEIDIASLNRLEQGRIKKVNPLMLAKLAKFYGINVIYFHVLIGYFTDEDVVNYNNSTGYTSNDEIAIPLFKNIKDIENKEQKTKRKINIPFSKNKSNLFNAFFHDKNEIFIFFHTQTLNNKDLFIFRIDSQYIISKYYIVNDLIILSDVFDNNNLCTFPKNSVKVIGKIVYNIKELT